MITVIAEHSVDLTLLPHKANILDLGCRRFAFSDWFNIGGHNVITIDPDPDVVADRNHYQIAITNYDGYANLFKGKDPQATRINLRLDNDIKTHAGEVVCMTLKSFSDTVDIIFWDLIKFDIEGSEYEVIMSLTGPPAKQLSIEFHLHTGVYGIQDVRKMEAKLHNLGYEFASHEMTSQHGMGMNYWDSLFILK